MKRNKERQKHNMIHRFEQCTNYMNTAKCLNHWCCLLI